MIDYDDPSFDVLIDEVLSGKFVVEAFYLQDTMVRIAMRNTFTNEVTEYFADYHDFVAHFAMVNVCENAEIIRGG